MGFLGDRLQSMVQPGSQLLTALGPRQAYNTTPEEAVAKTGGPNQFEEQARRVSRGSLGTKTY